MQISKLAKQSEALFFSELQINFITKEETKLIMIYTYNRVEISIIKGNNNDINFCA